MKTIRDILEAVSRRGLNRNLGKETLSVDQAIKEIYAYFAPTTEDLKTEIERLAIIVENYKSKVPKKKDIPNPILPPIEATYDNGFKRGQLFGYNFCIDDFHKEG